MRWSPATRPASFGCYELALLAIKAADFAPLLKMAAAARPTPILVKVSVILLSYNHAHFIPEAVASLLAQTVAADEVILCDDASQDGSRAALAAAASHFPSRTRVVTIFNEVNAGLAGMLNQAFAIAGGDLWVILAADDVAREDRIARTLQAYANSGGTARSICSNAEIIDEDSRVHGAYFPAGFAPTQDLRSISRGLTGVLGATQTVHRELWDFFGPLPRDIFQEDLLLPFRAALLGRVHYIPEALVRYRFHSSNMHFAGAAATTARIHVPTRSAVLKKLGNSVSIARQRLVDVALAQRCERITASEAVKIARFCADSLRDSEVELEIAAASKWALPGMLFAGLGKGVPLRRIARMAACYTSPTLHVFLLRTWIWLNMIRAQTLRLETRTR